MIRWVCLACVRGILDFKLNLVFPREFLLLLNESQVYHARTESKGMRPTVKSAGGSGGGSGSRIHRPGRLTWGACRMGSLTVDVHTGLH